MRNRLSAGIALWLGTLIVLLAGAPVWSAPTAEDKPEVLPSGPIHEAFVPFFSAEVPPLVSVAPPRPLDEEIPAEKPDLEGVQWIPGYYSFDKDRNDFVWVSGIWRVPPPDRQWVAGYWTKSPPGWRRVPGFWTPLSDSPTQAIIYYPAPPAPLVEDPGTAPVAGAVFAPGYYNPVGGNYVWEPGHWVNPQPGWSWVPAGNIWTPGGYTVSPGFWDPGLRRRGLAFAPLFIPLARRTAPGFSYQPSQVIPPGAINKVIAAAPRPGNVYITNAPVTNIANANWVKRRPLPPGERAELKKLANELQAIANQRRGHERPTPGAGNKVAPRASVNLPRPRARGPKPPAPPSNPGAHKTGSPGPKKPGTPGTGASGKPGPRKPSKPVAHKATKPGSHVGHKAGKPAPKARKPGHPGGRKPKTAGAGKHRKPAAHGKKARRPSKPVKAKGKKGHPRKKAGGHKKGHPHKRKK